MLSMDSGDFIALYTLKKNIYYIFFKVSGCKQFVLATLKSIFND